MSAKCSSAFRQLVKSFPASENIGVAFSGGPDSLVLLWLARNTFKNITAFTVDHKLWPETSEASVRAGELATKMGVSHRIIPVVFEEPPSKQRVVRSRCYEALLKQCKEEGIKTIFTGHNFDDHLGTMLSTLKMAGTVDSFAVTGLLIYHHTYPDIRILRPISGCSREDVLSLCKEEGLKWVDGLHDNTASFRRDLLERDLELKNAMDCLHRDVQKVREDVRKKVIDATSLLHINNRYGYITLSWSEAESLPKPVLWRLLYVAEQFISGVRRPIKFKLIRSIWRKFIENNLLTDSFHHCLITKDGGRIILFQKGSFQKIAITPGRELVWNNSWRIKIKEKKKIDQDEQYYVKPFGGKYRIPFHMKPRKRTIPTVICHSLPIIVDKKGTLVAFPHLENNDFCDVSFVPTLQMRQYGFMCF